MEGEHDLDNAENGFEKREMMKENKRLKKKLYKSEHLRIIKLVQIAYNLDPRIRKLKENEKIRQQELKELEKKKLEEEKLRFLNNLVTIDKDNNNQYIIPNSNIIEDEDA